MSEDKAVEILKNAILLEKRGKAFYSQVAQHTSGKAVKQFFEMMADEEVKHINILSDQFKAYQDKKRFDPGDFNDDHSIGIASNVLTEDLKAEIAAADYEAAAISAAMSMEERAIKIYSARAEEAEDSNEKALYEWLARWETQHLKFLSDIDRELKEQIWNDNSFWPF
ncbi:MAG: ferritin family protein [Desulfobacterales bacterium]|nr:MAG: ferritin family protein [Desulfobacterales bacterium]